VTNKAWFGPKRHLGWGWTPCSWEGWAATGAFALAVVVIFSALHGVAAVLGAVIAFIAFGAVMVATGTPPGDPRGTSPSGPPGASAGGRQRRRRPR
jgi:hypothetical protein